MQTVRLTNETPLTAPEYANKSSYAFESLGNDPSTPEKGTCFGDSGHLNELAVLKAQKSARTGSLICLVNDFAAPVPDGFGESYDDLEDLDDMFGDFATATPVAAPPAPAPTPQPTPKLEAVDMPPTGKRRRRTKEEIAAANGEAPPATARAPRPAQPQGDLGSLVDFASKLGRIAMFLDDLGVALREDQVNGLKDLDPESLLNAVNVIEAYFSSVTIPVKNPGVHEQAVKVLLAELVN